MNCSQCDRPIALSDPKVKITEQWWCDACVYYLEQQSRDERRRQEILELEERFAWQDQ